MTAEMWLTLAILFVAIALFITEWVRLDIVALGVLVMLMLTGILTVDEAISGFSSKIVLSIAALFIVGAAVFNTGLAAYIGNRILRLANGSEHRLLLVLMLFIGFMSAFISSTGVVALMLPAVVSLANSMKIPTSKLLIPLAFSALLGGTTTLIATPPNLVVSETLEQAGYPAFGFFSFTPLGILLLLGGILYMMTIGRKLLPERQPTQAVQQASTPGELFTLYRLPDNLFRLRVQNGSPLIGHGLGEINLRRDYGLTVVAVNRHSRNYLPLLGRRHPNGETHIHPGSKTLLEADDVLVVQGDGEAVGRAAGYWQLAIMASEPVVENDIITNEVGIAEVLLRPRSSLIGKSLVDVRFGSLYRLTVLSVRRPGTEETLDLKETPLKFGDVLLVQGEWKDIFALKQLRRDFVVMGEREAMALGAFGVWHKAPIVVVVLVAMVVMIALNIMELTLASMLAAGVIVITGCVDVDDAYDSIDWKSLVLIAGMLPMSTALVKVGLVDATATAFVETLGQLGPTWIMCGLFVLTVLLTQVLTNTASVVLIAPVALAAAVGAGVRPEAYLMTVAMAGAMSFATPVSSPVNTLVISAGHYRFSDYVRIGIPLILICMAITLIVAPLLWPF